MTATAEAIETPKTIKDIITALSKPIAERHLETRRQGGKDLTYISWHNAIRYLDLNAPGWCYEIRNIHTDEKRIYVAVRITITAADGTFYREATGTEELNCSSYGDPSSNAESMALRRAAAKWGLGLYLYDKSGSPAPRPEQSISHPAQEQPRTIRDVVTEQPKGEMMQAVSDKNNPNIAKTLSDMITTKQLGMLRAICRENNFDAEEESLASMGCPVNSLSRRAASTLIDGLMGKASPSVPIRRAG
jgi:hypothetical protein